MIKDKNQSKNDNNSNILDNNIKINNKKGLFQISSENSSLYFSTIISSPNKLIENKQKIVLNFPKITSNLDYCYGNKNSEILYKNPNNSIQLQNNHIDNENNKKEVNMIIQKSYSELDNSLLFKKDNKITKIKNNKNFFFHNNINERENKNEICPIGLIINDKFYDLLVNVYKNEGIEIGLEDEDEDKVEDEDENGIISEISENNNESDNIIKDNIKEKSFKINRNIYNNKDMNDEQISCICLKSKCLNNYCSCHKKGIICNNNCRCVNCENFDNNNSISSNELQNDNYKCKYIKTKFFSL